MFRYPISDCTKCDVATCIHRKAAYVEETAQRFSASHHQRKPVCGRISLPQVGIESDCRAEVLNMTKEALRRISFHVRVSRAREIFVLVLLEEIRSTIVGSYHENSAMGMIGDEVMRLLQDVVAHESSQASPPSAQKSDTSSR